MQNYKDLKVWEKAHHFTLNVYVTTKSFPKEEQYALTSQLRRTASSMPANIAEECGKNSQQDLAHFLNISLGSANKSEYLLILSKDLNYLPESEFETLYKINEIKGMLISLINKIRTSK